MHRILIAEDSRTQAERLRLILEVEGYSVEVAPDGALARTVRKVLDREGPEGDS